MSYYERHVFFCCNQRDAAEQRALLQRQGRVRRCATTPRSASRSSGSRAQGKVRINQAGCLDRCEEGPCVVVYPEAVWYTYVDRADIDEIIEEHLRHGRIVERLRISMRASTRREFVAGPAGRIECAVDAPAGAPRGTALVAHPHPLFGGTLDNKVVQTLARAFVELGYEAWRPNFRGVGESEGSHDEGRGEVEDLAAVLRAHSAPRDRCARRLLVRRGDAGEARRARASASAWCWSASPSTNFDGAAGARPTRSSSTASATRPCRSPRCSTGRGRRTCRWCVVPGADHFFHRKLHVLREHRATANWK